MKYSAFIFDFDFTIADASDGIVESANFALGKMGIPLKEHEAIRRTVGMTLTDAFYALTGTCDSAAAGLFREYFKEKADSVMTLNTVLFDDAIDTLKKLKERGAKTGIVTSKNHYRIDEVLDKHDIVDLVDIIIGFEDVNQPKPSAEGLLKAIELLGIHKNDVLYTGDSLIDAKTAQNAGVDFAAVTTGTTLESELAEYPHILISSSLTGLFSELDSLHFQA